MNKKLLFSVISVLVSILCASLPALAVEFEKGKLHGSLDTTLSLGASFRLDDPDPSIIALVNGGTGFSVNGDDGNLNYATGLVSLTPKVTADLELGFGDNFGAFFRGTSFYDIENEDGDRERTELSDAALKRVGSRTELLDAYLWARFTLGGKAVDVRLGEQVVNWGESTFIQGGLNAINPVNVGALRVPGAELREALLPVGLLQFSFTLTENTSIDLVYQYHWENTEIDPRGSYFSTNDFAGDGGDTVFLGFGSSRDIPPFSDPTAPMRPFLGVPRAADIDPDDDGQYGAALRWFSPALNQTEFGFYYMNYHSRLPTINAITGTLDGTIMAGTIGGLAPSIIGEVITQMSIAYGGDGMLTPAEIDAAITAGVILGISGGASSGSSQGIAGSTGLTFAGVLAATGDPGTAAAQAGGAGGTAATAFATDAYSQTARYYIEYPEDIKLYGLSFNTSLGTSGVALQGEVSFKQDAPLQVDDVELLFAALAPINPVFAGNSGIPGEPGASQLGTYRGEDYSLQFATMIPGYIRRDVIQYQATATKIFGNVFGAEQALLLCEVAQSQVFDMPSKDELRLEGPGTYTSGNPYHEVGNPGAGHVGKAAEGAEHFADDSSWGYRFVGRLTFENAIGAIQLQPRISWLHDVGGVSPGPGGSFIEGRQAITVGLAAAYQNRWAGDLSYTRYSGAGRYNLINDRDFIAANIKYSF